MKRTALTRAHRTKRGVPSETVQTRFEGRRWWSAVDDGAACRADSAWRAIERLFLYRAGFQIGRPKGCSTLMACGREGVGQSRRPASGKSRKRDWDARPGGP